MQRRKLLFIGSILIIIILTNTTLFFSFERNYVSCSFLAKSISLEGNNAINLGEYYRGNDTIKIRGRLIALSINSTEPIVDATVFLYLNISNNESTLIGSNKTDSRGIFVFSVFVSRDFPTGWIYFTVYYPGDLFRGYAPARFYYKAYIKERIVTNTALSNKAIAILVVLSLMLLSGIIISVRRFAKSKQRLLSSARWREVLDSILARIDRKDFNFVLLVGELIDALLRKYNLVPPLDAKLQEKLLMLKDNLSEEAFNILKNMVSLYELYVFGGPYAKTVLMNTLDFSLWKKLVERLRQNL